MQFPGASFDLSRFGGGTRAAAALVRDKLLGKAPGLLVPRSPPRKRDRRSLRRLRLAGAGTARRGALRKG